jgi:17beta-estradiol 17-dehydrogenase / very-long-chain 3-oxoacyl-CoA reductase
VITGASDGIGKEFALQLASKGFNVVLVSRTESKLEALAREIEAKHADIQTKILTMDFAKNNDEDYNRLAALVGGLDVAVLINNVGKSHDIPVPFLLTPTREMNDIITINCVGTLKVSQIIVPGMVQRRRGLILTMGSFAGLLPTPLLATYSGSKAFLQQWSTALGSELKPHGVQVELVLSYLVTSSMSKIRRPSLFIPNPKNFVRVVLGKIGRTGGAQGIAYTSTPYWSHGIMHWALATFAGLSNAFVVNRNGAMHESIRKRALKKQEREGKKNL